MAESYDISIKVVSSLKPCHLGHKVGDEWLWQDTIPGGMCFAAFNTISPSALVLKFGGQFPWQKDPDVITMSCPDYDVQTIFEIRRIPKR